MEEITTKVKKKIKSKEFKNLHVDFQVCHHCDNKDLIFIENFEFTFNGKKGVENVYYCEKCGCYAYLKNGERSVTYYPNIYDMKKHMERLGKNLPEYNPASKWVSDQDKQLMKN